MTSKIKTIIGATGVLILMVTALPMVGISLYGAMQREAGIIADRAETADMVRESVYKDVCPQYAHLTTYQKWVTHRNLAWCEDYMDRL